MSPIDHLHTETQILPVRTHSEMITKQFLLGCHLPYRVDKHTVNSTPSKRTVKSTLQQQHHMTFPVFDPKR